MELETVIESCASQLDKVLHCVDGIIRPQLEHNDALVGFHLHFRRQSKHLSGFSRVENRFNLKSSRHLVIPLSPIALLATLGMAS